MYEKTENWTSRLFFIFNNYVFESILFILLINLTEYKISPTSKIIWSNKKKYFE